jgi:NOL1/NOP2/fmu family ribosome biogenesis protein
MMRLDILNRKETGRIMDALLETYGFTGQLGYAFLRKRDEKIYAVSPDFTRIDDRMLRMDTLGLYFATFDGKEMRLTIEGSQIIGPGATKGVIDLTEEQGRRWLLGEDVQVEYEGRGYVVVRSGVDYLGCGRIRDKMLLNFIPKTRRVHSSF